MTTAANDKTLLYQATRAIREAYKRSDLTEEQISLLEAKGFPFSTDTACTDHLGNHFPTKKAMCEHWGVTLTTFLGRRSRGMSLKEALEGREPTVFDHTGQGFATKVKMAETWGITPTQLKMRLKRGWTLEEALTSNREGTRLNIRYSDHEGTEYPTRKDMCEAWGVDPGVYGARIANGWTIEEALTGNRECKAGPKPCTDHLGQTFPTQNAMCEHWGITASAYITRIKRGMSIEQALTKQMLKRKPKFEKPIQDAADGSEKKPATTTAHIRPVVRTVTDHLGNTFPSQKAMGEAWGVTASAYIARIKSGWSIERSLTTPVEQTSCQDHTGREFPTKRAMCKYWGVKYATYLNRLEKGWSLEEALTGIRHTARIYKGTACEDHEGNTYPSIKAMCRAWGVDYGVFNARIKDGWSVEEAITGTGGRDLTCTDHLGQTFPNKQVMCNHWGISRTTFGGRIAKGWSVEEALTGSRKCHDHLGNEFDTPAAMCRHYNLKRSTYENRLRRGWSLEEALTGKRKKSGDPQ